MILITSAAYVVPGIRNELGMLPPTLLPIGNKRLLEIQVESIKKKFDESIYIALPESFAEANEDVNIFKKLNVKYVYVPDDLNLAESLTYSLNVIPDNSQNIRILHGDTLIYDLPEELDLISIGAPQGEYDWEYETQSSDTIDEKMVWAGFFSFSNKKELIRCLTLSERDFVKAIRNYSSKYPIKNIKTDQWLDFGHLSSYFLSRISVTTERSFNTISIKDGILRKSGTISEIIQGEEFWYKNIPLPIKPYIPHLMDAGKDKDGKYYYCLEYLSLLPLNELFVFGRNLTSFWRRQFELINKFLEACKQNFPEDHSYKKKVIADTLWLLENKTIMRLDDYLSSSTLSLSSILVSSNSKNYTIKEIRDCCIDKALSLEVIPSVLHGDFCLSNILYDSRSNRLKVIDPRGISGDGEFTIYGDQKYDIAKLAHSFIGLYDLIIAGNYRIEVDSHGVKTIIFDLDNRMKMIQELFISKILCKTSPSEEIMPLVILLFLSMLPMHADRPDRQEAMLLNAGRLFKTYVLSD